MSKTALKLAAITALGLTFLPAVARADVRIEEQGNTLDTRVKRWIAIKGDKRAIVTRAEPKGPVYNAGARYGAYVEIARPDKELIWELDPQERSYREHNAAAFIRLLQQGIQPPRDPNDQPLRTLYRSQTTTIEVVPTGKEKRIAGFPVEQVLARVVVGAQNQVSGNQFNFTFDQEIWITKDERLVKEIHGFESAYFDTFGTAATLQQAQLMAGAWNDAFITHLRAVNDRVRALQGVPLSVTTTVTEEALAQVKGEKSTSRKLAVGSMEVKKISLDSIPDSEFELPVGYINQDTKVVVRPPAPASPVVAAAKPSAPELPSPPMATEPVKPEPAKPVVAAQPKPMPAAEAPAAPEKPVAAAQPKPAPTPEAEKPGAPEKPAPPVVAATPMKPADPAKPAVAAAKPAPTEEAGPVIPIVKPGTSVLTPPPTNVVVRGADGVLPPQPKTVAGKTPPVLVPFGATPPPTNNIPVLGGLTYTTTRTPPPPVVIDEPDYTKGKRQRKRKGVL